MMSSNKASAHLKRHSHVAQTRSDNLFDFVITLILVLAVLVVAYPLIYVVSASFSSTTAVMAGKV